MTAPLEPNHDIDPDHDLDTALARWPQPAWNVADSISGALAALRQAHDGHSANEASGRLLWAIGNNQTGTCWPVVLAVLPLLTPVLQTGTPWAQQAALEVLIDLGATAIPEPGHEVHDGIAVQAAVRAFIAAQRPWVDALAQRSEALARGSDAAAASAQELLELIDDLSA